MMTPMYVTAFMDVEDLVAPEADDIARDCAEILLEEGIPVTFCVVGEKARLLLRRGRGDVIAALRQHDIGLHTDFHSVHPTIAEAMEVRDWEEGVVEALRSERPGAEAIEKVFGAAPSCWGGPGNTWGPQVCEALYQLGIPAFVYAHTAVPEGGVHRFARCIAYPNGPGLSDVLYQDDAAAEEERERLRERLNADREAGYFWQQVFLGHPTRILHEEFWDAPNFAKGANPPRESWKPARRKSQADLDRALANFRRGAHMLRNMPGIELRSIRQINADLEYFGTTSPVSLLSPQEQEVAWQQIEKNLVSMKGWPILPPDFKVHNILTLTHERLNTLERCPDPRDRPSLAFSPETEELR